MKKESRIRLEIYTKQFEYYKGLLEKSIDQLDASDLFKDFGDGTNSIAIIMKHIAGNMISRWTNIFEEDGEKSWRNRDSEFENNFQDRSEVMAYWEKGWSVLFSTLEDLTDSDLDKIIYIRNMGCSVHDAIIRQLCHYPYHIGQVVFAAKLIKRSEFESLSIPKGASKRYNAKRFEQKKSLKHFTDDIEETNN